MKKILILGGGFAGVWAAMRAAAEIYLNRINDVEITLITAGPDLIIRPRLYEAMKGENNQNNEVPLAIPLEPLLSKINVKLENQIIKTISPTDKTVTTETGQIFRYDKLIYGLGSQIRKPSLAHNTDLSFDCDSFEAAMKLNDHIKRLPIKTCVEKYAMIVGASFTGIEIASEMRGRLPKNSKIILVDQNKKIASELGDNMQPLIMESLLENDIKVKSDSMIEKIIKDQVYFSDTIQLPIHTLIWATGMNASPLTKDISNQLTGNGRVIVDPFLRSPDYPDIYVAGDSAYAQTDETHHSLMSCQHAMPMGKSAGLNAVHSLTSQDEVIYRQEFYATCLDLGPWGAIFTTGWDRKIEKIKQEGKNLKQQINQQWIMPPSPEASIEEICTYIISNS